MNKETLDDILMHIEFLTSFDVKKVITPEQLENLAKTTYVQNRSLWELAVPMFTRYDARSEAKKLMQDQDFLQMYQLTENETTGYLVSAAKETKTIRVLSNITDTLDKVTSVAGLLAQATIFFMGGGPAVEFEKVPEEVIEVLYKGPVLWMFYKDPIYKPQAQKLIFREVLSSIIPAYSTWTDLQNLYVTASHEYTTMRGLELIHNDHLAKKSNSHVRYEMSQQKLLPGKVTEE
jgi:hypothetical protein